MKRVSLLFVAIAACCLLLAVFGDRGFYSSVSAQGRDEVKNRESKTDQASDRRLATLIRQLTDGPASGPAKVRKLAGGGILTDLRGGYQNVMLSRMDDNGEPIAACVTNLQEANDFLGRNLETGERFAKNDFGKESTAVIAARHGMSEDEYLFYSKLAAEAVQQDILSRPESATITIVN
ncbi:MAG: hypothetical protein HOP17_02250, partial [Acidobacteria bacterium]|nr:hypothetical protein [Acidobacteriota bacterium]